MLKIWGHALLAPLATLMGHFDKESGFQGYLSNYFQAVGIRSVTRARGDKAPGAESEKSQQCRKYFIQYSIFAKVRKWGHQTYFLPLEP